MNSWWSPSSQSGHWSQCYQDPGSAVYKKVSNNNLIIILYSIEICPILMNNSLFWHINPQPLDDLLFLCVAFTINTCNAVPIQFFVAEVLTVSLMTVKFRFPIPEFLKSFSVFSRSLDRIWKLLRSMLVEMLLIWVSISPMYWREWEKVWL